MIAKVEGLMKDEGGEDDNVYSACGLRKGRRRCGIGSVDYVVVVIVWTDTLCGGTVDDVVHGTVRMIVDTRGEMD